MFACKLFVQMVPFILSPYGWIHQLSYFYQTKLSDIPGLLNQMSLLCFFSLPSQASCTLAVVSLFNKVQWIQGRCSNLKFQPSFSQQRLLWILMLLHLGLGERPPQSSISTEWSLRVCTTEHRYITRSLQEIAQTDDFAQWWGLNAASTLIIHLWLRLYANSWILQNSLSTYSK